MKPNDYAAFARAFRQAGGTLTPDGERMAAPRRICCFCNADLGPAGPGHHADTHGMCQPPCPEAIALGWGE